MAIETPDPITLCCEVLGIFRGKRHGRALQSQAVAVKLLDSLLLSDTPDLVVLSQPASVDG